MKNEVTRKYIYSMLAGFGAISLSVVFFFILYRMQGIGSALDAIIDILSPFIYGGVIAYLLRPICNWLNEKLELWLPKWLKKGANAIAVVVSIIFGILVIYALIIMIAPQLYASILSIWSTLPEKVDALIDWSVATFGENQVVMELFDTSSDAVYAAIDTWARENIAPKVSSIVTGVGMSIWKVLIFLKNFLIGLIVAVYLLAGRKGFKRHGIMVVRSALKPRWADLVLNEVAFIDRMFGGFIDGKLVDSAIIGVLCYIGCVVFRFPNALLVSAIVGVTNVIPFFGPFIGAIPSILLILIESPIKAFWFALFVLVLQQLDGNVIGPAILGDRTGLQSFWVLFSIILFGGLWGLVGMVICVPLFAVIYDTIRRLVYRGLAKHNVTEFQQKAQPEQTPEQQE